MKHVLSLLGIVDVYIARVAAGTSADTTDGAPGVIAAPHRAYNLIALGNGAAAKLGEGILLSGQYARLRRQAVPEWHRSMFLHMPQQPQRRDACHPHGRSRARRLLRAGLLEALRGAARPEIRQVWWQRRGRKADKRTGRSRGYWL